jgi:phosphatidylglycerol:prolipoprotein diacylglycerol transferase
VTGGELAYGAMVGLAACAAFTIRRVEGRRLGYVDRPGYRFVGLWCVAGAIVGARLGMLFYVEPQSTDGLRAAFYEVGFDGKTVLGALTGGYIFGEIGKRVVGVRFSTGDALAVALPVGQALGRIGCFIAGCCFGTPTSLPWAVVQHGVARHPVQLYEAAGCVVLASVLFAIRRTPRPPGPLFRLYLVGYAAIRFCTEFVRGEPQLAIGPVSWAQMYCLAMGIAFALSIHVGARGRARTGSTRRDAAVDRGVRIPQPPGPGDTSRTDDPTA